jgi:hypothetical protein
VEIGDICSCFVKQLPMSPISCQTALLMKLATQMPDYNKNAPMP